MPLHEQFKMFSCTLEVTTPYATQRQQIEAPRMMLEQEFASLVQQTSSSSEPVMVSISRTTPVWNRFDQRWSNSEYYIRFKNNAYITKYGAGD